MTTNRAFEIFNQDRTLSISFNQIFTYLGCSAKYCFQYVERRQPERQSVNLFFGSAIHTVLERFYLKLKTQNTYEDLKVLTEFFETILRLELDYTEVPVIYKKEAPDTDSAVELGKAMIAAFYENFDLGDYEIVDVELPLKSRLYTPEGIDTGYMVNGVIDLLLMDKQGQCLVVDSKTAAKPKKQATIDEDLQFSSYAYLLAGNKMTTRTDTINCRMDVLRKLKKPKVEYYYTSRTAFDRKRFAKLANAVLKGIENQVFIPSKSWLCSDCQYQKACQSW